MIGSVDRFGRTLVVAPHPDDEVLGTDGLIQRVLARDGNVHVVLVTAGDGYPDAVRGETGHAAPSQQDYVAYGARRIAEARAALAASEIQVEEAARELVSEREAARADYEAAALEVEALAGSGLPAATLAAQLAAQGYDGGRLSLLERLDAERALSDLAERLVRARLELRRAEARLDNLH